MNRRVLVVVVALLGAAVLVFAQAGSVGRSDNFVTVSHLSGSRAKHILDIEMFNYPTIGWSPGANLINRVIFRSMDTRPGYRQLYPISTLGLKPGDPVVTPDLLMLKVAESQAGIGETYADKANRLHSPPEQMESCREAVRWIQMALPVYQRRKAQGDLYGDDVERPDRLARLVDDCNRVIARATASAVAAVP